MTAQNAIIHSVPVAHIQCTSNVRLSNGYDNESLKELAASLKNHGMMQPIVLRKREDAEEGDARVYAIVAGRRRFMASLLNDAETVPCIVSDTDEARSYEFEVIENIQRENMTLADTARAVRLLATIHDKPAKVCEIVGKSQAWVSKHLTITSSRVPTAVAQMLDSGIVSDLETLLLLIQIDKQPGSTETMARMIRIADAGNMNRQIARDALARLKAPAKVPPTPPVVKTTQTRQMSIPGETEQPPEPMQSFSLDLPIRLLEKLESLGGAEWIARAIEAAQ